MSTQASVTATNGKPTSQQRPRLTAKAHLGKLNSYLPLWVDCYLRHIDQAERYAGEGDTTLEAGAERAATLALRELRGHVDYILADMQRRRNPTAPPDLSLCGERLVAEFFDGAHAATDEATVDTEAALAAAIDATVGEEIQAIDACD